MGKYVYGFFTLLLLVVLLISFSPVALASKSHWSVQAGTYALSAIKFAVMQFDVLAKDLKERDLDYLRIEKGNTYYIIRLGRFREKAKAVALLNKVKKLVPDAFILKQRNPEDITVARLYKRPEPELEEYYTLQIDNFLNVEQAKEKFNAVAKTIHEDKLKYLRIEKAGEYYSVRIGKYENYGLARDFQSGMGEELIGAIILKAFVKDEQIIDRYGEEETSDVIVVEGKKESVEDLFQEREFVQGNVSVNPEPVDAIINEVSTYFDNDDLGKAAELLRKGLARWPDNPDLHAWYGATLLNMRFPEKAYEQYRKAIEMSPDVPDYHAGLGFSLLDIYMDKARNSIEAFKKALDIDPDNVDALEGLGIVYVSINKKDLATEIYLQLRELDNDAALRLHQIISHGLDWEE